MFHSAPKPIAFQQQVPRIHVCDFIRCQCSIQQRMRSNAASREPPRGWWPQILLVMDCWH